MEYNTINEQDSLFNPETFSQNPFIANSNVYQLQLNPGSPEWFKNYIYSGGLNDAEATKRGIEWVVSQGMRPQDAVNLWNQALGTSFNVSDLFSRTGSGPEFTNFGQKGSWQTGANAENDAQTGMIRSADSYFQRGNEVVVSDELFWNPNSPTGAALAAKIQTASQQGQRPGVVITPYAVFQGKATNEQLLNEVKNSGASFVALDPYLGWGVSADDLFEWTKNFIPQLNALGKEVKLVTQGFAKKGEEEATKAYNDKLLSLPGVSEVVNFGLEDWFPEGSEEAKQLFSASSEWVPLGNDYKPSEKKTIGEPATQAASTTQQTMQTPQSAANVGELAQPATPAKIEQQATIPAAMTAEEQRQADIDAREAGATAGAGIFAPSGVVPTSNLLPSDIEWLSRGGGMFNNPLYSDPTSPIDWALQFGIGTPAINFLTGAAMNAIGMTDASMIAQDAKSLADIGLTEDQIISTLQSSGVPTSAAVQAGMDAAGGSSVFEIAQNISGTGYTSTSLGSTAPSVPSTITETQAGSTTSPVNISGTTIPVTGLANIPVIPSVQVTAPTQAPSPAPAAAVSSVIPSITNMGTQQTTVTGSTATQQNVTAETAATVLSNLLGQPVTVAGATQQVQVPGQPAAQQITPEVAASLLSAVVGQQVTVAGQTAQPSTTSDVVSAATGGLLSNIAQSVPVTAPPAPKPSTTTTDTLASVIAALTPTQTVPVTAPPAPKTTTTADTLASVIAALTPTQTVPVTAPAVPAPAPTPSTITSTVGAILPSLATILSTPPAPTPAPSPAPVAAPAPVSQTVNVTDSKGTTIPTVPLSSVGVLQPVVTSSVPPPAPAPSPAPAPTPAPATQNNLLSTSDLLKLLGLLGGIGTGTVLSTGGTGTTGSIPPSDLVLGSTTPTFGSDYYSAIQRYYNAYMPQYPRNVAGPLQQWYENKYGA